MIALIQRVKQASVAVQGETIGAIDTGLLALVAVQPDDTEASIERMAEEGRMNLSVQAVSGGVLLVSQFTLAADTRSGLRPSFTSAAPPEQALAGFNALVDAVRRRHDPVATGRFGADMQVSLVNDGPVTFWLET